MMIQLRKAYSPTPDIDKSFRFGIPYLTMSQSVAAIVNSAGGTSAVQLASEHHCICCIVFPTSSSISDAVSLLWAAFSFLCRMSGDFLLLLGKRDTICGLVVRVPGYRSRAPGSEK
jgi:hypothetical protein